MPCVAKMYFAEMETEVKVRQILVASNSESSWSVCSVCRHYDNDEDGFQHNHNIEKDPVSGRTLPSTLCWPAKKLVWFFNGEPHNNDKDPISGLTLPASRQFGNDEKSWYLHGKSHRSDIDPLTGLLLPALQFICKKKLRTAWFVHGSVLFEESLH